MHEIVIKNGLVIDGTGSAGYRADIAIAHGVIVEIGKISDGAKTVIDASDLVVSPGFIDPHTHYDAQICWDRMVTPSSWHGVTTAILGNCSVGIAPCKPDAHSREVATWDLVTVESIPYDVLNAGITWDWESFPEYMDAAERRQPAINLGFFAPLTPFRHYVMGDESMDRGATVEETAQIKALIKDAVSTGAFGFSMTNIPTHVGYQKRPLASRMASQDEFKAYANALKELDKGAVQLALTSENSMVKDDELKFLEMLLDESGRPVTWITLLDRQDRPGLCQETLAKTDALLQRGAKAQVSVRPLTVEIDMRNPMIFRRQPVWQQVYGKSVEEQSKIYRDPTFRDKFREEKDAIQPGIFSNWDRAVVHEAESPAIQQLIGRTVSSIAEERGQDPVDTLFDLSLEDNLNTNYAYQLFNIAEGPAEDRIKALLTDPRTMFGFSDAGAHADLMCNAGYSTYLLGTWVRERQAMPLEHAIKRLTSEPADFLGIKDRGRLAVGMAADIVVFDAETVGSVAKAETWHDLPAGGKRVVVFSEGINATIVNGQLLYRDGEHSGAMPGKVVRS